MDRALAAFVVLHAMGSTAGLLAVFHAVRAVAGTEPTGRDRGVYAAGGLLVVVGLGFRYLLFPVAADPPAPLAALPATVLRPAGTVLALVGAAVCLWALARLVGNRNDR